jgi:hypothetical protein
MPRVSRETVEEVSAFNSTQLEAIRAEALRDLYFFAHGILGYNGLQPHVVGPLANFISYNESKVRLSLMPRGHHKTTIATIADSLRVTLANPAEENVLVVNEIHDNAVDIVSEILSHLKDNPLLRVLFPGVIPDKFAGPGVDWSATRGASLVPRTGKKDPSFLAAGINTAVTSKHFSRLKLDDLVGFEAYKSPAALTYAKRWVDNITPLTMGPDDTVIDFVGTRWALNDLYRYLMDLYGASMSVFRRGMTENGKAIWPEKFTSATIAQLQKTPDVYYAQYDNNPLNEASLDFDISRLGTWWQEGPNAVYDYNGDRVSTPIRDLTRLIAVDPNSGSKTSKDEAGLTVTGVDSNDCRLCLEDASGYFSPEGLLDAALDLVEKWGVGTIGVEKAGQQTTEFWLRKAARKRGLFVRIVPLSHGNQNKQSRILKALQPLVAAGQIFLHQSQQDLRKQFVGFGSGLDDRIDSFSYHVPLVRAPLHQLQRQERIDAVEKILKLRSSTTGY